MFQSEGIITNEDIKRINLVQVKEKYKLGKASLEKLVKLILDNDLYEDAQEIQNFILKNKLSTYKAHEEVRAY